MTTKFKEDVGVWVSLFLTEIEEPRVNCEATYPSECLNEALFTAHWKYPCKEHCLNGLNYCLSCKDRMLLKAQEVHIVLLGWGCKECNREMGDLARVEKI
jgi:hypothetical protein